MNDLYIGYDDNLGLPSDFTETIGCITKAYHELDQAIDDFEQDKVMALFIPCGTLPYIKNYQIIAQSILPPNKLTLCSRFVTTKKLSISALPAQSIGRVNQYCTTSFWAPLISLMKYLAPQTSLEFVNTNGFPDMLHKTAEDRIDCSMVWDIIMQQHPEDANKVHELFNKSDLPTPVIISKVNIMDARFNKLKHYISQDRQAFFSGFQEPEIQRIDQFIADTQKARKYFTIKEKEYA